MSSQTLTVDSEPTNLYCISESVAGPIPYRILCKDKWDELKKTDKQTLQELIENFLTFDTVLKVMIKWHENKIKFLKDAKESTVMSGVFKPDGKLRDGIASIITEEEIQNDNSEG